MTEHIIIRDHCAVVSFADSSSGFKPVQSSDDRGMNSKMESDDESDIEQVCMMIHKHIQLTLAC